jgi:ubiquinone/menaquinone biosynthesis C-methylase UbiE
MGAKVEEVDYDELEPETYERMAGAIGEAAPVLDVGCGEGKLANFLAATLGKQVCGIDISGVKLARARETAEAQGISHLVQFLEGDASNLDLLANKSFGAIVSVYTLHEFDDPREALRELGRVLRAEGRFIVMDFVRGGRAEKLWGERYYTPQEIESMLQEAGFSDISTEFVCDDVVFVSSLKV